MFPGLQLNQANLRRLMAAIGSVFTWSGGTTGLTPATATSGDVVLGGTLNVAHGGTGAATLTGYVKGAGTTALTASASVPVGDISGLGTGVATALGVNVGSAGSPVVNGGALGTPSSGSATNLSGLPVGGISGLGTGVATALAINVGTAGAPLINGGVLGTPASGTLTNCTGLPGTGIAAAGTSWTPVDSSGAGLTFTAVNAKYQQLGNIMHAYFSLTFPSTVNASAAIIGGLPVPVPNQTYAAIATPQNIAGVSAGGGYYRSIINSSTFSPIGAATGNALTNAQCSLLTFTGCIMYPVS